MKGLRPSSARGFTLIEALAAIAVMVILLPVLLRGFSIAGDIATMTRQRAEATALAQSQLDELLATQEWQLNTPSGSATFGPDQFVWATALSDFQDATGAAVNVQMLTMTVQWSHHGYPNQVRLETVVYIPGSTSQSTSGLGATPLGGGLP